MSETDIISSGTRLPKIKEAQCIDGKHRLIYVSWGKGPREGRTDRIDLSPLIDTYKFYRPLRNDPTLFATVHVANSGSALAWGDGDEIDMAANSIMRLAEETMTADDFKSFLERNGLTQETAAILLGRSPRQLKYYLSAGVLPRLVSLACIGLEAHSLKPRTQNPTGWMKFSYTLSVTRHNMSWNTAIHPLAESHKQSRRGQLLKPGNLRKPPQQTKKSGITR